MMDAVHREHAVRVEIPVEPLADADPVLVPTLNVKDRFALVLPVGPKEIDLLRPLPFDENRLGGTQLVEDQLALHELHRVVLRRLRRLIHRLQGGLGLLVVARLGRGSGERQDEGESRRHRLAPNARSRWRATFAATMRWPSRFGWMPSSRLRRGRPATPSSRKGISSTLSSFAMRA